MKKRSYSTLEDWKRDYAKVQQHPNDVHLIESVVKCVENSSEKVKQEIKEYLANAVLESDPWTVLEQVGKDNPDHFIFVKSRDDVWFSA